MIHCICFVYIINIRSIGYSINLQIYKVVFSVCCVRHTCIYVCYETHMLCIVYDMYIYIYLKISDAQFTTSCPMVKTFGIFILYLNKYTYYILFFFVCHAHHSCYLKKIQCNKCLTHIMYNVKNILYICIIQCIRYTIYSMFIIEIIYRF